MQKLKRIFALVGVVLLVGMYLATLVLALTASPATQNMLMAAIACTVIIPCVLYAILLTARILDRRNSAEHSSDPDAHTPDRKGRPKQAQKK